LQKHVGVARREQPKVKSIPCWFRPEAHTAVASRYLQPPTEEISQHHPVAARQRGVRRLPAYVQIDGQRVVRPPAQLDQHAPESRPGPVSAYLHTDFGGTAAERRPLLASRHATYGRNPPSRRRGGGGRQVSTAAGTVSRALRLSPQPPRTVPAVLATAVLLSLGTDEPSDWYRRPAATRSGSRDISSSCVT